VAGSPCRCFSRLGKTAHRAVATAANVLLTRSRENRKQVTDASNIRRRRWLFLCLSIFLIQVVRVGSMRNPIAAALASTTKTPEQCHVLFRCSHSTLAIRRRREALSKTILTVSVFNHLHLCEAAIHKQLRTGNVTAVVGCKKHHGFGDLIGHTEPTERNIVREHLQAFLGCS
jgi:hypothetical protein